MTIQNKWMYYLKLHSCYGRQSLPEQNGCFQWLASMLVEFSGKMLHYFSKCERLVVNQSKERPLVLTLLPRKEWILNSHLSCELLLFTPKIGRTSISARRTISKSVRNELSALLPESSISTIPVMRSVWFSIDVTCQCVYLSYLSKRAG